MKTIINQLKKIELSTIVILTVAVIVGLIVGVLISVPVNHLPWEWSGVLAVVLMIVSVLISAFLFYSQKDRLTMAFSRYLGRGKKSYSRPKKKNNKTAYVLDTSAVIDGRIVDIIETGFLEGEFVVHDVVLQEIKRIADSKKILRKQRGRRGLEIMEALQKQKNVPMRVHKNKLDVSEVDEGLILLAQQLNAKIITTDYNLHKRAKLTGISVLNINELANMVKTTILPNETLTVELVQKGKEKKQAIAYLPDGTMVVVERGEDYIGQVIKVSVDRVLQTEAGRMIFGTVLTSKES